MANRLCQQLGHQWVPTLSVGWFRCSRSGCGVLGVCVQCVAGLPKQVLQMRCLRHRS
jgi:hypothetical protein